MKLSSDPSTYVCTFCLLLDIELDAQSLKDTELSSFSKLLLYSGVQLWSQSAAKCVAVVGCC